MTFYDAKERGDLAAMVNRIDVMPTANKKILIAGVFGHGLMFNQHSWWIKIVTLGSKLRIFRTWHRMFVRYDAVFSEAFVATMAHLLCGNDTEDVGSVGGFSQRELSILSDLMDRCELEKAS